MDKADPSCRCSHHWIAPAALILIGADFLANALGVVSDAFLSLTWPVLLILAGAVKLFGRRCHCC